MAKFLIFIIISFQISIISGQSFINGNFEKNNSTDCDYNLIDSVFNLKMSNVYAFGKKFSFSNKHRGEMDILTYGCYVDPENGNWCIGLGVDTTTDAIAIELTNELVVGQSYKLSFYLYGNTSFSSSLAPVEIGESITDSIFGTKIDTLIPVSMQWRECVLQFTASQNSKFITVRNTIGIKAWNQVDNFKIEQSTGTNNYYTPVALVLPNPSTGLFNFYLGEHNTPVSIEITNSVGSSVYKSASINSDNFQINLLNNSSGIYYYSIVKKDKHLSSGILFKY